MEYIENVVSETLSGEKNGIDGKVNIFYCNILGL